MGLFLEGCGKTRVPYQYTTEEQIVMAQKFAEDAYASVADIVARVEARPEMADFYEAAMENSMQAAHYWDGKVRELRGE